MSSYSYVLFRNVSLSLNPETLWKKEAADIRTPKKKKKKEHQSTLLFRKPQSRTCRPWTDEKSVRGRERDTAGLSLPSFRPDVPHQWMEAVLHISSTRSMVLSLQ